MLAAIALAALTQAQASAKEAPTSEAATRSITTVLHPGWNAVAWLGPEAPVTDLFDAVPALRRAYAWDVAEQRFRGSSRNSIPLDGLSRLTTGMGLFVQVGGDAPVEWTRTALAESALLSLREGLNLVGWAGRDGVPVENALAPFGGPPGRRLAVGRGGGCVRVVLAGCPDWLPHGLHARPRRCVLGAAPGGWALVAVGAGAVHGRFRG